MVQSEHSALDKLHEAFALHLSKKQTVVCFYPKRNWTLLFDVMRETCAISVHVKMHEGCILEYLNLNIDFSQNKDGSEELTVAFEWGPARKGLFYTDESGQPLKKMDGTEPSTEQKEFIDGLFEVYSKKVRELKFSKALGF